MLASRASYDKKTLARQVIALAPGYQTALSSRPDTLYQAMILLSFIKTLRLADIIKGFVMG